VEVIFLIAGLSLITVGALIIVSEARSRHGTTPVQARVIGFSLGKSMNPNLASYHPVAEYIGLNGGKYYIEGSVGSSVPLHRVGQTMTVLATAREPEKAVLKSGLSYMLGGVLSFLGLVVLAVFWLTFRLNIFSVVTALLILGGLAAKIKRSWRTKPLSLEAWREYKKKALGTRVFTDASKDQISWADPLRVTSAIEGYRKANRFAVPVLLILGLSLLFLSYHFHGRTQTFIDTSDHAVGTVVGLSASDSSDGSSTYAAVVEYNDRRGVSFKFVDSFSSSPPYYQTGQAVNVLYSREDPNKAQIDRGLLNYWLTILFGVLAGLFLFMGLRSAAKQFGRSN
jgi:hypothetical protein